MTDVRNKNQISRLTVLKPADTIEAAGAVAKFVFPKEQPSRATYLTAISRLQGPSVAWDSTRAKPLISFAGSDTHVESVVRHIMAAPDIKVLPVPPESQMKLRRSIEHGLASIANLDVEVSSAIDWCVGSFPCAFVDGIDGGSISSLIGVIWLGVEVDTEPAAIGELILHEYVHQSLFLEDMVRGVFVGGEQELAAPEALVITAIQKRPRGYDKGFHSAFVALSLARYWQALASADKAKAYFEPAKRTLEDLISKQGNLTPYGQELLKRLADEFAHDTSVIAEETRP